MMRWLTRRRGGGNDMVTPGLNGDRTADAARELSVSQRKLEAAHRLDERLARIGVTPDEYGRAIVRGYLTRRSA